jgi:hypothetical protein
VVFKSDAGKGPPTLGNQMAGMPPDEYIGQEASMRLTSRSGRGAL